MPPRVGAACVAIDLPVDQACPATCEDMIAGHAVAVVQEHTFVLHHIRVRYFLGRLVYRHISLLPVLRSKGQLHLSFFFHIFPGMHHLQKLPLQSPANTTPIQEEGSSLYCYVMISHAPPYTSYDQRSFIGLLCCVGEHASILLFAEAQEDQHKERVKLPSRCFRKDATDMDPQSSILSRVLDTPAIGKSYAKQAHQTYRALMHWIRIWSGVSCFCSQR